MSDRLGTQLIRSLTHELRAENSIRFGGIGVRRTTAVELASEETHLTNVF
jgi:hypothetical protein